MPHNEWEMANWLSTNMKELYRCVRGQDWMRFSDRWRPIEEDQVLSAAARSIESHVSLLEARARESDNSDSLRAEARVFKGYLQAQRLRNLVFLYAAIARDDREWNVMPHFWPSATQMIDLTTGESHPHTAHELVSRYSDVEFDPDARAPRWNQFLYEIQQGDREMISYLQRSVGYSMTGLINEQVLFILFGSGANGKNIFLEVLYEIFGSMGHQTTFGVLEKNTGGEANPGAATPHLAIMQNKRYIMASESIEGSRFNDGLVKSLTGDGQITARGLFKSVSVFRNTGKFWLACNNMPRVSDVTPGFWRRLHIVPFLASFNGAERDLFLKDKLIVELPGILNWCLEGAQMWYATGLKPPHKVANAVAEYRGISDPIGGFLEDCCVQHANVHVSKMGLYQAYREYSKMDALMRPLSRERFYTIAKNHGFEDTRVDNKWVFKGVCLRRDVAQFAVTREELAASVGG